MKFDLHTGTLYTDTPTDLSDLKRQVRNRGLAVIRLMISHAEEIAALALTLRIAKNSTDLVDLLGQLSPQQAILLRGNIEALAGLVMSGHLQTLLDVLEDEREDDPSFLDPDE